MIFGIGTDIVAYARIKSMHDRHGARAARRILSSQEMVEYSTFPDPARLLMKRFAAKEALSKAAGTGLRHPLALTQVSVTHDELGKPAFAFADELAAHLSRMGIARHHLSISDERDMAVAFVVLEGEADAPIFPRGTAEGSLGSSGEPTGVPLAGVGVGEMGN